MFYTVLYLPLINTKIKLIYLVNGGLVEVIVKLFRHTSSSYKTSTINKADKRWWKQENCQYCICHRVDNIAG